MKSVKLFGLLVLLFAFSTETVSADILYIDIDGSAGIYQQDPGEKGDQDSLNWYNKDPETDGVEGIRLEKAYNELDIEFKSEPIIVAVLDGGVDPNHEDLKAHIWVNEDEIADNGIDDDENGYVDDVHGWNFLGGRDGKSINTETLEITREYKRYKEMIEEGVEIPADKKEYYEEIEKEFEKQVANAKIIVDFLQPQFEEFEEAEKLLKEKYGLENVEKETLDDFKAPDLESYIARQQLRLKRDILLNDNANAYFRYFKAQLEGNYNPDLNVREEIVGDDPEDFTDTNYGSNDVLGASGNHGTFVAGIIGAVRSNDIGMKGVCDNVLIMPVTAVPNGDERDKDIALGIRYAVDNGARIINMSFGKAYSPFEDEVEKAIKYAQEHGVLLVHAAGNDAANIDTISNFPNKFADFFDGQVFSNFIEVGATTKDFNEMLPATYTNYGKVTVDIMAPGTQLYSTRVGDKYGKGNGTSYAAPVVSGVAALLLSIEPDLTPEEIIDIIMKTSKVVEMEVNVPDGGTKSFKELSISGGIIDAYAAVKYLLEN